MNTQNTATTNNTQNKVAITQIYDRQFDQNRFGIIINADNLTETQLLVWNTKYAHPKHEDRTDVPKMAEGYKSFSMKMKHLTGFCADFGLTVPDFTAPTSATQATKTTKAKAKAAKA